MDVLSQGFCLINNVAVGVRYAQLAYPPIERCAIIDFDVHHGNGTQVGPASVGWRVAG